MNLSRCPPLQLHDATGQKSALWLNQTCSWCLQFFLEGLALEQDVSYLALQVIGRLLQLLPSQSAVKRKPLRPKVTLDPSNSLPKSINTHLRRLKCSQSVQLSSGAWQVFTLTLQLLQLCWALSWEVRVLLPQWQSISGLSLVLLQLLHHIQPPGNTQHIAVGLYLATGKILQRTISIL